MRRRTRSKASSGTKTLPRASQTQNTDLRESFEQTLSVLDSAVTGAILAGLPPKAFDATLSYTFLDIASHARNKSKLQFQKWTSSPRVIWQPVLDIALELAADASADDCDPVFIEELDYLRESGVFNGPLSEIEEQRYNNQAVSIIHWAMNILGRDPRLLSISVEMALLVTWFKCSALWGETDDEIYAIVRVAIPEIFERYCPLLE